MTHENEQQAEHQAPAADEMTAAGASVLAPRDRSAIVISSLREFLVVLLSILVAFALDAWWQELEEEQLLAEQLQSLYEEFAENHDSLMSRIRLQEQILQRTNDFIARLDEVAMYEDVAIDPETFALVLVTPTFDASIGSLQTLVASGHMARIEDAATRRELASWSGTLSDASEDEDAAVSFVATRLIPYFDERIDLLPVYSYRLSRRRFPEGQIPAPITIERTQQLLNMLARRRQHSEIVAGSLGRAARQVERILDLLGSGESAAESSD